MAGGWDTYYLYEKPNPALTQLLVSPKLRSIVTDWLAKVEATYMADLMSRKSHHRDGGGMRWNLSDDDIYADNYTGGDAEPHLYECVDSEVFIGGYENDRWVAELRNTSPYAMADEVGRHMPSEGQHGSTTQGHHSLTNALYAHLPQL